MVASEAGMMDGRHTGLTRKAPSANREVGRWQAWDRMRKSSGGITAGARTVLCAVDPLWLAQPYSALTSLISTMGLVWHCPQVP